MTPPRTQSFRSRDGVVRIAARHGRGDVASVAARGYGTQPADGRAVARHERIGRRPLPVGPSGLACTR